MLFELVPVLWPENDRRDDGEEEVWDEKLSLGECAGVRMFWSYAMAGPGIVTGFPFVGPDDDDAAAAVVWLLARCR